MPRKRPHRDGEERDSGAPPQQKRKLANPPDWKSRLVDATVLSAVEAVLKDANAREKKRAERAANKGKTISDLMASEISVYLAVTLKEPPFKAKLRPYAMEGEDDVCLFVKDPQDLVKDYLEEHGNGGVTEVIGVERLRKEYGTHEGRRELLNMYDLFLVDNRVSPIMPGLLGNAFLEAKKMPLHVDMRKNVVGQIRKAISSTALNLRQGTSTTVRVGRTDFTAEQIVENLVMAVDGVVRRLPAGWDDIQSLNLKSNKSPALPIYLTLPTASKPYVKPERAKKMVPGNLTDDNPNEKERKEIEVANGESSGVEHADDREEHVEAISISDALEEKNSAGRRTQKRKKKKTTGNSAATNDGSGNGSGPTSAEARALSEPEAKAANKTVKRKKGQAAIVGSLGKQAKKPKDAKPAHDRSGEDAVKEQGETRRSTRKRVAISAGEKGATDAKTTPATKAMAKPRSMRKNRSAKK